MSILMAEIRKTKKKGKQLRRQGIVPAVLYGKHLEESICLQIPKTEVDKFVRANAVGSKLDLVIDGEKYMALLKEVDFNLLANQVEHLSFLEMRAGELVNSVAQISLINEDSTEGIIQQTLSELPYRCLPEHLVERIEIDIAEMEIGTTISVSDLDIFKNENIEVLTAEDVDVVTIAERVQLVVETEEDDDEASDEDTETEETETEETE